MPTPPYCAHHHCTALARCGQFKAAQLPPGETSFQGFESCRQLARTEAVTCTNVSSWSVPGSLCSAAYSRVNAFGVARRSTSSQLLAADTEEASHRRRSTHRPFSADGDSAARQDSADRPAHSPLPPRVRCEYSNILMVPTSAPGLHVRGMGIATSLAGHRRTVISPGRYQKNGTK
jgi:hypothetical protein